MIVRSCFGIQRSPASGGPWALCCGRRYSALAGPGERLVEDADSRTTNNHWNKAASCAFETLG